MEAIPAISVIIPMYNAEKYVGECLECFLNQTFQNFEVIVVDDCSTDNSRAVVESYREKFGGRLNIYSNEKNSGAGVTRNIGLLFSRGKYIYFMDADDLILLNSLEKMYTTAEKFNAEIVNMRGFYMMREDAQELYPVQLKSVVSDEEEFLIDDDLAWRTEKMIDGNFYDTVSLRLFLRDFLIDKRIFFPENVKRCEDVVWKYGSLLLAKRIVHLPFVNYFYRMAPNSLTRQKRTPAEYINSRMTTIIDGIKYIDGIINRVDFLRQNPQYRYAIFDEFMNDMFKRLFVQSNKRKWSAVAIYEAVKQEFGEKLDRYDILVAELCSLIDAQQRELDEQPRNIKGGSFMAITPAVSVIIPMYNAERYIAECLDSILLQTFQDYEVIVIDDCSTDTSLEIVESYLEKFGGCLKIFRVDKNVGVGAARNKGLNLSRGEYVFFMDADDLLMLDGLEEMHTLAKSAYADVVDCARFYKMSDNGKELLAVDYEIPKLSGMNSLMEESIDWRIKNLLANKSCLNVWSKFLRRDFLIENELFFPEGMEYGEDQIWTHGVLFRAKIMLHLPKAYYFYRQSKNSIIRKKRDSLQTVNVRLNVVIEGLRLIDDVMEKTPFFQQNPQLRHKVLDHFTRRFYNGIFKYSLTTSESEIYESLKQEFGKGFGEYDVLIPALCTLVNANQRKIENLKGKLKNK